MRQVFIFKITLGNDSLQATVVADSYKEALFEVNEKINEIDPTGTKAADLNDVDVHTIH